MALVTWLHWFSTFDGVHDPGWAIFWGGIGSCLSYITVVPLALRHLNCHEKHCWRLGKHEYEMDGAKYKLCPKHHPAVDHKNPPRASDFEAHRRKVKP